MITKCCNSCAFLDSNFGKPNPSPDKVNDPTQVNDIQWYSQENLDRLWENTKDCGRFLTCHSTDPSYYGKKDKTVTACLGFTLCIYMHIDIYQKSGFNFKKYRDAVGHKMAMTKRGMAEAAFSMSMGCADLFGKFKIPRDISEDRKLKFPTGFEKTVSAFKKFNPTFKLD